MRPRAAERSGSRWWPARYAALVLAYVLAAGGHRALLAEPADEPDATAAAPTEPEVEGPPLFRDPDAPLPDRVADLIGRLTLEEKISLIPMASAAIERFDIPAYDWWNEGNHGVSRAGEATMFPQVIAMAATWDPELIQRVADAISTEARAKHNQNPVGRYRGLTYWCPAVDPVRDPRWGRIEETYGEDPWLISRMTVAYIRGMQGDHPRYLKTAATAKHFAVHGHETRRFAFNAEVSPRDLREYYLPTFRTAFQEGKAVSVMTAFNALNGIPCTVHPWLLTDLLRKEWGFEGAVVTDAGAPRLVSRAQNYVDNVAEAYALAIKAGVDVLSEGHHVPENLKTAIEQGWLSESDIDRALTNNLTIRFRLGMFDPPELVPWSNDPPSLIGAEAHMLLARETARASIVLLKNEAVPGRADPTPLLPLDLARLDSIALVGPNVEPLLLGSYSGTPPNPPVPVLQGILEGVGDRVLVRHVPWDQPDAAVQAAMESDIVIAVLGLNEKIEREGHDRKDLDLPQEQDQFIRRILAVNPATVVVMMNAGPVLINWIDEHAPSVVQLWYPGEQGGRALAEMLTGQANPAGRLPLTYPASMEHIPPLEDYNLQAGRTYMYDPHPPLYAFGHGLSYSHFEYANLKLSASTVTAIDTLQVSVEVTNTSARDGDEVVQLYVRYPESAVPRPIRQLRGFERLSIPAGQTRTVQLPLHIADLAYWDEQGQRWVVESGRHDLEVGASSADARLTVSFEVR